ncbi:acyl-CoA-binding protein [Panacagrimonas sp.]|uniref:acyl-CoA-binding protein n=1 Tax=Panacagrimonas sp. TaxID=2480088 RepID=UPI003B51E650
MTEIKELFEQAQKEVKTLTKRPSNEQLLQLYSLFKQATDGDVSGSRPGMLDMVGRAKFDAWTKLKGTDAQTAMQQYVSLVQSLVGKGG